MIKFELLSKIRILEKLPSPTLSLTASNTSDFSDEISDDINVCFLDIVDIWKICTNQYFPSEQYMLQNHEWAKDPFNKSGGPRDSGATEKRSSLMRFQISLQLTFKKSSLVELHCSVKEEYPQLLERAIKTLL